ncbi:MAG: hypothetical protein HFJ28_01815 [Clostridia bacterium]|jgi:type II secretory pathway pseudopilin PulG|nr:hypothetical protein [Clostridia bacterium]
MKKENGMTLITTVILVIVIAALVFAVVYYARIAVAKESLENLKTDLLLVQAKVKNIAGEYTLDKKEEVLKGTKLQDMKEDTIIQEFLKKEQIDIDEKNKKYYVLKQENLVELSLEKVTLEKDSYYVVEYTSSEVYYTKGFTYTDGKTYYEMTQIENLEVENVK